MIQIPLLNFCFFKNHFEQKWIGEQVVLLVCEQGDIIVKNDVSINSNECKLLFINNLELVCDGKGIAIFYPNGFLKQAENNSKRNLTIAMQQVCSALSADASDALLTHAKGLELLHLYCKEQPLKNFIFCKSEYDRERLDFAKNYLIQNYDMPPTIAALSRIAGINEQKLKNGFKERFGKTIHTFLTDYKMEIALRDLQQKTKNPSQLAFDLGFSSLQHFSKAFKQYYGFTPKKIYSE
jgi:AraC-like DNA-binding protein